MTDNDPTLEDLLINALELFHEVDDDWRGWAKEAQQALVARDVDRERIPGLGPE